MNASIPQHSRFIHDCIQQKWTKGDVVHVHVNRIKPRPACLHLDLGYVAEKRNINYCYLYYNMICPSLVLVLLVSRYKQLEDG
ncbi:hypothetical protein V6N13_037873 [Hibiscus sabdariffa]|uniref:Uncharacterized protein n=2 Tax=Hibiscus sabdariffa TaxID=183260 RepID=A0ABR2S4F4_9ROSI